MNRHLLPSHQSGMTLIEIMISMLIGVFLLGGVLTVFTNSRQTFNIQENLSTIDENGRFALDYISTDLRMAGFFECSANPDINIIASPIINAITNATGGTDDGVSGTDDSGLNNSDSVTVAWRPGFWNGNACFSTPPSGPAYRTHTTCNVIDHRIVSIATQSG